MRIFFYYLKYNNNLLVINQLKIIINKYLYKVLFY